MAKDQLRSAEIQVVRTKEEIHRILQRLRCTIFEIEEENVLYDALLEEIILTVKENLLDDNL